MCKADRHTHLSAHAQEVADAHAAELRAAEVEQQVPGTPPSQPGSPAPSSGEQHQQQQDRRAGPEGCASAPEQASPAAPSSGAAGSRGSRARSSQQEGLLRATQAANLVSPTEHLSLPPAPEWPQGQQQEQDVNASPQPAPMAEGDMAAALPAEWQSPTPAADKVTAPTSPVLLLHPNLMSIMAAAMRTRDPQQRQANPGE